MPPILAKTLSKVAGIPAGGESNPLKQRRRGRIAEPTRSSYGQPRLMRFWAAIDCDEADYPRTFLSDSTNEVHVLLTRWRLAGGQGDGIIGIIDPYRRSLFRQGGAGVEFGIGREQRQQRIEPMDVERSR